MSLLFLSPTCTGVSVWSRNMDMFMCIHACSVCCDKYALNTAKRTNTWRGTCMHACVYLCTFTHLTVKHARTRLARDRQCGGLQNSSSPISPHDYQSNITLHTRSAHKRARARYFDTDILSSICSHTILMYLFISSTQLFENNSNH
jgi:hypothetical protein